MSDENVSVSFGADASGFLAGVESVSAALKKLPAGVNAIAEEVGKTSRDFSKLGDGVAAALGKIASGTVKLKTGQSESSRATIAAINHEIAAEKSAFAQKKTVFDELAKLKIISNSARIGSVERALDSEYAAEKALLDKELAIEGQKVEQRQQVLNKLAQLDARYAQQRQKLMFQSVEQMVAPGNKMVDSMSSSLSSGIMGMIERTKTFKQVLRSLAQAIVQQFVKMGVDLVANWAKGQIAQVVLSQTAEGQKTAAAIAGATARTAVASSGAAASAGAQKAAASLAIGTDAGQAGAGITAFLAPFLGPAAIGAGEAGAAQVLSFNAFDIGAWSIPQDQLAMVHQNELIMPAAEAGAFRAMLTGAANGSGSSSGAQSGGDVHAHFNVSAIDAAGVKSFFANNSKHILKALNGAVKNGDHLGLRALGTA